MNLRKASLALIPALLAAAPLRADAASSCRESVSSRISVLLPHAKEWLSLPVVSTKIDGWLRCDQEDQGLPMVVHEAYHFQAMRYVTVVNGTRVASVDIADPLTGERLAWELPEVIIDHAAIFRGRTQGRTPGRAESALLYYVDPATRPTGSLRFDRLLDEALAYQVDTVASIELYRRFGVRPSDNLQPKSAVFLWIYSLKSLDPATANALIRTSSSGEVTLASKLKSWLIALDETLSLWCTTERLAGCDAELDGARRELKELIQGL